MLRRGRKRWAGLVVLATLAAGCGDDGTGPQTPEDVEFAPALGVDLATMTRLPSGVYVQTLTEGEGEPVTEQDEVEVGYKLWLSDGTLLQIGTFPFGLAPGGGSIEGFRLGVLGMRLAEKRLIVIPSALGYGAEGYLDVPPNAVLVFEVTLQEIAPRP